MGSRSSQNGIHTHRPDDLALPDASFANSDLTSVCCLDELDLRVVGQNFALDRASAECRVVDADLWCTKCGAEVIVRDTFTGRLAHEPLG